jgi:hypothetical protein
MSGLTFMSDQKNTVVVSLQDEVQTALESFFRVGEAGGKTLDRFDELMKVWLLPSCKTSTVALAHILLKSEQH